MIPKAIFGLLLINIVLVVQFIIKHNRCPSCGKTGVKWTNVNWYTCKRCRVSFEKKTLFFNLFRKAK